MNNGPVAPRGVVFNTPQGPQGEVGMTWQGTYSGGTTYAVDDAVSYNGSSYICILASTGNLPTDDTYWELLADKGDTGDTGAKGDKGDTGDTGAQGDPGEVTTSGTPVDDDFAKFTSATEIEGRSYAEVKQDLNLEIGTDVLAQQTIGIADDNLVEMDDADATDNDYAKFTANGLEGRSYVEVKTDLSLNNVDNTSDATKNSATATLTNKTLEEPIIKAWDGLQPYTAVTPTFTSTSNGVDTISFTGVDVTDKFSPGRYVICSSTAGSNLIYRVKSSSFSTNTTVELVGETSVSGTITAISYLTGTSSGGITPWNMLFTSRLYHTTSTSINHNTETLVPFNSEDYDPNSNAITGASAKITAPVSGYYRQIAQTVMVDFSNTISQCEARLKNNSSIVARNIQDIPAGGYKRIANIINTKQWVNRGEDIELYIFILTTDTNPSSLDGAKTKIYLEVEFVHL